MPPYRIAIIGAGLQGKRHARAARNVKHAKVAVVADLDITAAQALGDELGCGHTANWEDAVGSDDVDVVIVCTPPHLHASIATAALHSGKHVLCEKPLARTAAEGGVMLQAAAEAKRLLGCGFNLRYHPGLQQVRQWVDGGEIGPLMFARCLYGIGGREGYETDWRADPNVSGGGELMDQGIHALDLCRWFLGDIGEVSAMVQTAYWPVAPLEDNAFIHLRAPSGAVASVHVSWTQWTPVFLFEVFGKDGYARAEGLGGAYGLERAVLGKRDFQAPFSEREIQFRSGDTSWASQLQDFLNAIQSGRPPAVDGRDGYEAVRLAEAAYQSARTKRVVAVNG